MSDPAEFAPLWRRLAASLYDVFPILALWMVTGAIALGVTHGEMDVRHPPMAYRVALFAVTAAYFVFSWSYGGQTLGGRAWSIRVLGRQGKTLPLGMAIWRCLLAAVSWLVLGLGFLWMLIDPQRRAWHDLAARSQVIRVRK
jgi:uncharacterized RDD family membrane protein YckC